MRYFAPILIRTCDFIAIGTGIQKCQPLTLVRKILDPAVIIPLVAVKVLEVEQDGAFYCYYVGNQHYRTTFVGLEKTAFNYSYREDGTFDAEASFQKRTSYIGKFVGFTIPNVVIPGKMEEGDIILCNATSELLDTHSPP